jgi:hypothetical protein
LAMSEGNQRFALGETDIASTSGQDRPLQGMATGANPVPMKRIRRGCISVALLFASVTVVGALVGAPCGSFLCNNFWAFGIMNFAFQGEPYMTYTFMGVGGVCGAVGAAAGFATARIFQSWRRRHLPPQGPP